MVLELLIKKEKTVFVKNAYNFIFQNKSYNKIVLKEIKYLNFIEQN